MAIQAIIHKYFGTVLQRSIIAHTVGSGIEWEAFICTGIHTETKGNNQHRCLAKAYQSLQNSFHASS
jgi:hypothetical protein